MTYNDYWAARDSNPEQVGIGARKVNLRRPVPQGTVHASLPAHGSSKTQRGYDSSKVALPDMYIVTDYPKVTISVSVH